MTALTIIRELLEVVLGLVFIIFGLGPLDTPLLAVLGLIIIAWAARNIYRELSDVKSDDLAAMATERERILRTEGER